MADDKESKLDPRVKELFGRGGRFGPGGGRTSTASAAAPDEPAVDLDPATQAELQRWFGLPSFGELEAKGIAPPVEDPEIAAVRERREQAIAAIDPALVEAIRARTEPDEALLTFTETIELRIDPSVALLDLRMIERAHLIAEPREVAIPEQLQDDLRDCTPQALLRDLHRSELDFEKTFEIVDYAAAQRLDIVAAVAEAMATSWKLPPFEGSPVREAQELMASLAAERRRPWPELFAAQTLPNRRFEKAQDK